MESRHVVFQVIKIIVMNVEHMTKTKLLDIREISKILIKFFYD